MNAILNNSDFKCFLKIGNELLCLSLSGRYRAIYLSTDRSEREDVTGCKRVERYGGVEVEQSLYVSSATVLILLCR